MHYSFNFIFFRLASQHSRTRTMDRSTSFVGLRLLKLKKMFEAKEKINQRSGAKKRFLGTLCFFQFMSLGQFLVSLWIFRLKISNFRDFFFFFNLWVLGVRTENEDSLYVFLIREGKMESSTKSEVWKTGELWWELTAVSKCSYTQTHLFPQ